MSEQESLAKIAALESELAQFRKMKRDITINPAGVLQQMGVPKEHVTEVLVADHLGDKAPPQLRAAAAVGPTLAKLMDQEAELAALRQRLDASDKEARSKAVRESTKTTGMDKSKYPYLAAALAADPSYLDAEAVGDSAEATAAAVEARLARAAKAFGFTPPASTEDAGKKADGADAAAQGTGRKPQAHQGGNPPPVPQSTGKVGWSDDDRIALRDEIVRKAERGEYDIPTHPYRLP